MLHPSLLSFTHHMYNFTQIYKGLMEFDMFGAGGRLMMAHIIAIISKKGFIYVKKKTHNFFFSNLLLAPS